LTGHPSIEDRLAALEDHQREIWDLRRALTERLEAVNRGRDLFDAPTRAMLHRLRELEHLVRAERREAERLVDDARESVVARRAEQEWDVRRWPWSGVRSGDG
jgi:hypothetical protein